MTRRLRQAEPSASHNPFLPYEQDLFVASISDRYIALLDKFNVIDRDVLIVTREFEDQEKVFNPPDFAALCIRLREVDGLAFDNGGGRKSVAQTPATGAPAARCRLAFGADGAGA